MKLLFENWREYLNEDADMMDESMVWARERAQRVIGYLAQAAMHFGSQQIGVWAPTLSSFPNILQEPPEPVKTTLHDDIFEGLYYGDKYPESLKKRIAAGELASVIIKPLEEQIIKEMADFGGALEKIWADPDLAQFKEKLMERTIEDWRSAKALAESIV